MHCVAPPNGSQRRGNELPRSIAAASGWISGRTSHSIMRPGWTGDHHHVHAFRRAICNLINPEQKGKTMLTTLSPMEMAMLQRIDAMEMAHLRDRAAWSRQTLQQAEEMADLRAELQRLAGEQRAMAKVLTVLAPLWGHSFIPDN